MAFWEIAPVKPHHVNLTYNALRGDLSVSRFTCPTCRLLTHVNWFRLADHPGATRQSIRAQGLYERSTDSTNFPECDFWLGITSASPLISRLNGHRRDGGFIPTDSPNRLREHLNSTGT
jgi:hypothetical protein